MTIKTKPEEERENLESPFHLLLKPAMWESFCPSLLSPPGLNQHILSCWISVAVFYLVLFSLVFLQWLDSHSELSEPGHPVLLDISSSLLSGPLLSCFSTVAGFSLRTVHYAALPWFHSFLQWAPYYDQNTQTSMQWSESYPSLVPLPCLPSGLLLHLVVV